MWPARRDMCDPQPRGKERPEKGRLSCSSESERALSSSSWVWQPGERSVRII